jgi:hypothetical protein
MYYGPVDGPYVASSARCRARALELAAGLGPYVARYVLGPRGPYVKQRPRSSGRQAFRIRYNGPEAPNATGP